MSEVKFHNKYRILSSRLRHHVYEGGMYFVAICIDVHQHFFGEIKEDSTIVLSDIEHFLNEQTLKTKKIRKDVNVEILVSVIIPNYVHLIICINGDSSTSPFRNALNATLRKENISLEKASNHCGS